MPRTSIPVVAPIGPYPVLPLPANEADLALTAADVANGNAIAFNSSSRLLVIVRNTAAATAYTISFDSAPDALNREGDISAYELTQGDIAVFLFERTGWRQPDGDLHVNANNAAVHIAALRI